MKVDFQCEKLSDVQVEMESLLEQHYQELTMFKEQVKLKPVWSQYLELERRGEFVLFTARVEGQLVGYSSFFLRPHIHYGDLLVAVNDVLFLREDLRQGMTGIRLLRYSEKAMEQLGAKKITWHVKVSNDWRVILHRMGYVDEDIIVSKICS